MADQLRVRLEFARILERQDAKLWPKLTAFLNAQRIFLEFPTLLIMDSDGRILFRYGAIAHTLDAETIAHSDWHFSSGLGELYRVYREPVWLGTEGQGTLLMLKPLDNATLKALVIPEFSLAVRWEDKVVAVSRDDYPEALAGDAAQVVSIGTQQMVQARLEWPGTEGLRPVLLAYRELHDILPFREFMYWLLGALSFITLLLWLALGQWLSRTVRRLESVDQALDAYAEQAPQAVVQQHLAAARGRQDEINNLTDAISELVQAVEAREREQVSYLETLALLEEAVLELDCDGLIRHASPGWNKLAHCDDAVGRNLLEFIHPADASALHAQCAVLRSGEKNHLQFRVRLAGPNPEQQSWIECRFLGFHDERGKMSGIRGVLRDITQTYLHEKQVSHMALHDALTGLPNRVLLEDRLKIALRMATRSGDKVCMCFIDIDHFKNVNDTLGHKAGDRLLVAFANRCVGNCARATRWHAGAGTNSSCCCPVWNEQDIREVTHKVSAVIQQPLLLEDMEMAMTFSSAWPSIPMMRKTAEVLFSQADRAMFYAKAQGRNQSCFFRDMTTKGIGKKELYIQNRLATAINSGQIQAWFQPIICARSDACIGVEVLARWHDDELGWISPRPSSRLRRISA